MYTRILSGSLRRGRSHRSGSGRLRTHSRRSLRGPVKFRARLTKPLTTRAQPSKLSRLNRSGAILALDQRPRRYALMPKEAIGLPLLSSERMVRSAIKPIVRDRGVSYPLGEQGSSQYLPLFDSRPVGGVKSVCATRAVRKSVLFARNVAGSGLRRSPGRAGSYHRTEASSIRCERSL